MCNDSGYSADESDTENVTRRQHKHSSKQKKREKKHRCDSGTDASENSPLYKSHSAVEAFDRGKGGNLNVQHCGKQRQTVSKGSTQPKVEKMPVTFSYTSPACALKSFAIVTGRSSVLTKPLGGFVLLQQAIQYTANGQLPEHPHYSMHQHQRKPLCTIASGHAGTNDAKLGPLSSSDVTKQFKIHANCKGTTRQQKLIATQSGKEYSEEMIAWRSKVYNAAELLHAGYYSQMLQVFEHGHTSPSLHTDVFLSVVFGCGLAYYKMTKYQHEGSEGNAIAIKMYKFRMLLLLKRHLHGTSDAATRLHVLLKFMFEF